MGYHNFYQRLRVKAVQEFDRLYYEKENHRRCHKQNWLKKGQFIFGVSYDTYLEYLKADTSDIPAVPSEAVEAMQCYIEALAAREQPAEKRKGRAARAKAVPPAGE